MSLRSHLLVAAAVMLTATTVSAQTRDILSDALMLHRSWLLLNNEHQWDTAMPLKDKLDAIVKNKGDLEKGYYYQLEPDQITAVAEFFKNPLIAAQRPLHSSTIVLLYNILKPSDGGGGLGPFMALPSETMGGTSDSRGLVNANAAVINETAIIQALGTYLAERFRDELTLAFLEKFREAFNGKPILNALFPATFNLLASRDPVSYPSMGHAWRAAFESDLRGALGNLWRCIDTTSGTFDEFKRKPYYRPLSAAVRAFDLGIQGTAPVEVLGILSREFTTDAEIDRAIQIANMIVTSARKADGQWLTVSDLRLLESAEQKKYFAGLLFNRLRSINEPLLNKFLADLGGDQAKQIEGAIGRLHEFLARVQESEAARRIIRDKSLKSLTSDDYVVLLRSGVELISSGYQLIDPNGYKDRFIKNVVPVTNNAIAVYQGVVAKDYGAVLANTLAILRIVWQDSPGSGDNELREAIFTYGTFLVDIATADDAEDVQRAIESAALPTGSYKLKRNFDATATINAYVGFSGGVEYIDQGSGFSNGKGHIGLSGPLGVEGSIGANGGSWSLFASIIDLGAIVNLRLNDPEATIPEIGFKQILSPGISIRYGFAKSPVSIGIGAALSPELRDISSEGEPELLKDALKISLSVAVDMPLFVLFKTRE